MKSILPKRLSGLFHRRSIFYQTLLTLIALFLVTAVFFGYVMSSVFGGRQREQIVELNLAQMRRASDEVELAFDLLSSGMVQNLWTSDFLKVMIDPEGTELSHQSGVLSALKTYQDINDLVEEACLYTPFSQLVYTSTGVSLPLEYSNRTPVIEAYLERYAPGDANLDSEWHVLALDGSVYLFTEMHTPVFVGLMFLRLHNENLLNIVQSSQTEELALAVFDEDGTMIMEIGGSSGLQAEPGEAEVICEDNLRYNGDKNYYQVVSQRTGWRFYSPIDHETLTAGYRSIVKLIVPALLTYVVVSILFSLYITRKVYQPIGHLMKLALPEGTKPEGNETDFLELAYTDSLSRNEQYQDLMRSISQDVVGQQLRDLLFGQSQGEEHLWETLSGVGASELLEGRYQAAALRLLPSEERTVNSVELTLYQKSLIRLVREADSGEIRVFPVLMDQLTVAVVLWCSDETAVVKCKQYLSRLKQTLGTQLKSLPFGLLLGKGKIYTNLDSIGVSYQEALSDIHYQQYYEGPGTEENGSHDWHYLKEKVQVVLQLAFDGKKEEAQAAADLMLQEFLWKDRTESELTGYCSLVMDEVLEWLIESGCPADKLDRLRKFREGAQESASGEAGAGEEDSSIARMRRGMEAFCREAIRLVGSSRKNRYQYVKEAKSYIAAHYMDSNLSLNEISEYIGITASYLSSLFAEVTGQNFSGYLNEFRIEQAKLLLRTTGRTITEVGYKCGFNSVQSFSRSFKKFTRMTPNGYRESQREQGGKS